MADWSFREESAKQRKKDDVIEAILAAHKPGQTTISGYDKRGMSLKDWAESNLPSPVWNRQAQEQVGVDALVGAAPLGYVAKPAVMSGLAALALSGNDANAESKLSALLRAGRAVFRPTELPSDVWPTIRGSYNKLSKLAVGEGQPELRGILDAMRGGSNVFSLRAVPQGGALTTYSMYPTMYRELAGPIQKVTPADRHRLSTTPGWHAAPVERPGQVVPIIRRYKDEGFSPRVGVVHSRVENPILISDSAAEHPFVLAANVGADGDLRKFMNSSLYDPTVTKDVQASKFVTDWLSDRGVDAGIYDNIVEGVKYKKPTHNFVQILSDSELADIDFARVMGGEQSIDPALHGMTWNPSVVYFNRPKDLVGGLGALRE